MIKTNALTYQYPLRDHKALNQVNLDILPGTLTLVTGASGSGKSTLLRCMNGLVPHFTGGVISGQISVFGSDPITEGVETMAKIVGFVFQEPESQFVFDTVEDEIAFTLENQGISRDEMDHRIQEVLSMVNLSHLQHKNINEISGGEQQKVAIASALVAQPKVLLLDEPTSQLDPRAAEEVLNFIVELKSRLNLTVLISEHRLERLLPYADLLINMDVDTDVLFGKPQEILRQMHHVPPIIEIARRFGLSPLPLTPQTFPHTEVVSAPKPPIKEHAQPEREAENILALENLSVSLGKNQVLHNVSLVVHAGEILVLMGPNGAGKTTLLRSILKMVPSSGKITLGGVDISMMQFAEVIQNIAYLPQNPNDLLFAESVCDELKITLKNHNLAETSVDFDEFLSHFGLTDKCDQYPRDLSVGERQRTALAAITVHDPQIIFMDEPTRGLDYQAKGALSDLFHQWRKAGKAVLLVTHDVEFAAHIADRVAILEAGHLIFTGRPVTAFTDFPAYQTQTAKIFPGKGWITPENLVKT